MGTLYIVSTPIGNLKDITLRAIEVLGQVEVIACEDTRKTGLLLKKLDIPGQNRVRPRLLSYFEGNEEGRVPQILKMLQAGQAVALVSNAGTPAIADPGFKLVRACLEAGIKVCPVPGPSAVLASLVASGLPTDKFLFLGFLPKKAGKRKVLLEKVLASQKELSSTMIIYLSPHRILKELEDIKDVFGDVEIILCQELTKIHENISKLRVCELIRKINLELIRGEIVIVTKALPND